MRSVMPRKSFMEAMLSDGPGNNAAESAIVGRKPNLTSMQVL